MIFNHLLQDFFISIPDIYKVNNRVYVMKSDRFFIYNLLFKSPLPILDYKIFLLYKFNFFKIEQSQLLFSAKKFGMQWCQFGKMIGMAFRSGIKREKRRNRGRHYKRIRLRLAYSYRGGRCRILLQLKPGQIFLPGRFRMHYFMSNSKKSVVQLMRLFLFRKPFEYKVKGFYR